MGKDFVMLSKIYNEGKFRLDGSMVSEKLDGMRCLWIPQTRGMSSNDVPFMNKEKDNREYICSGLWSRQRKPIMCPDWFVEALPKNHCLDGELFAGRANFQQTMSAVKKIIPIDAEWSIIKYCLFDIPPYAALPIGNMHVSNGNEVNRWFNHRRFNENYAYLRNQEWPEWVEVVKQEQLPVQRTPATKRVQELMDEIVAGGGEGVMLRQPHSVWEPGRSSDLVKLKPEDDAEGVVIGHTMGKGKLEGLVGAFNLDISERFGLGKTMELSGFTDDERRIVDGVPVYFPLGTKITFKYSGLTDDGIPKIARYFRKV